MFQRSEDSQKERQQYARAQKLSQIDDEMVVGSEEIQKRLHQLIVPSCGRTCIA